MVGRVGFKQLFLLKVEFFSHSKVEQMEVGTTVTINPCVPIILCSTLSYNQATMFVKLGMLLQVLN